MILLLAVVITGLSWNTFQNLPSHKAKIFLFVNLLDVPSEHEIILDSGTAEWPRGLRVCSNNDVVSITYSSHKPVEGTEYRA